MLIKTLAFVLHHFPCGERSIIVRMYTREVGLQSYLIPSARGKNSPLTPALMNPLQGLELIAYNHNDDRLERIKETARINKVDVIHQHPIKTTIAQFMAEVILRSTQDHEPNSELFDFISHAAEQLENPVNDLANLPLFFTLKLTEYLGFYPHALSGGCVLDLREGAFSVGIPHHPDFAKEQDSKAILEVLGKPWTQCQRTPLTSETRLAGLKTLEKYYRIHLNERLGFKSLDVLHMVLS